MRRRVKISGPPTVRSAGGSTSAATHERAKSEARFFIERMQELEGQDLRARVRGVLGIPLEFRRQHVVGYLLDSD